MYRYGASDSALSLWLHATYVARILNNDVRGFAAFQVLFYLLDILMDDVEVCCFPLFFIE